MPIRGPEDVERTVFAQGSRGANFNFTGPSVTEVLIRLADQCQNAAAQVETLGPSKTDSIEFLRAVEKYSQTKKALDQECKEAGVIFTRCYPRSS